tara:strand:- start:1735 stop:2061 length:327 start_codon:yes stop_codon:yes gene_type:complete
MQHWNNSDWMAESDGEEMPEKRLWGAVIARSLMDANAPEQDVKCNPKTWRGEREHARHTADSWLRSMSRDFVDVCTRAGIDPNYLREAYMAGRLSGYRLQRFVRADKR